MLRDECVCVYIAWRVLTLRMEERPPIWRVAYFHTVMEYSITFWGVPVESKDFSIIKKRICSDCRGCTYTEVTSLVVLSDKRFPMTNFIQTTLLYGESSCPGSVPPARTSSNNVTELIQE